MTALICIPSRLASTRLPNKPLLTMAGKSLVAHVVARAQDVRRPVRIVVATDAEAIAREARAAGVEAVMTDSALPSGTDRVAAVAALDASLKDDDVVLNLQGDQPMLPAAALEGLLDAFVDPRVHMATVICPLAEQDLHNPHVVKVVRNQQGDALYFSRATIPHLRDSAGAAHAAYAGHVGVYGYRKATLLKLASASPCVLEEMEALEQLRALWLGIAIRCVTLPQAPPFEINTPEDLRRAEDLFTRAGGSGARAYELCCQDVATAKLLRMVP